MENVPQQYEASRRSRRRHGPVRIPTAPLPDSGCSGQFDGREHIIVLLPGPPHEMKALFECEVRERLRAKVPPAHFYLRTLKIAMLGESLVDARVSPIYKRYTDVDTTILAGAGEIELHFKTHAATLDAAQRAPMKSPARRRRTRRCRLFAQRRIARADRRLLAADAQRHGSVAESCTGGLLAERITSISGSSRYFLGGAVVYSNVLKTELAGVPDRNDSSPRRSQPRSCRCPRRRHSLSLRVDVWAWYHRSSRPKRRHI